MQHKQVFAKMNQDQDVRALRQGDYRFLRNGINIQGTTTKAFDAAITSLYGNALLTNAALEANSVVVGFLEDRVSNRAFFAVYNSNNNHTIYQVSSAFVVSTVLRTSLFGFTSTGFVDMDIIGDILILTNNVGEIKKIDVTKAIAGGVYTPLATEITLLKPPPLLPLTWSLSYESTTDANLVANHYFQFYYRYIYENYDYSVFSPSSDVTNSWVKPSTNVDLVSASDGNITLSGTGNIDGIGLVTSYRVLLVSQTNPVENGIWVVDTGGAWARAADFPAASATDLNVYVTRGFNLAGTAWRIYSTNVATASSVGFRHQGPNKVTVTRPATPPATVIGVEYAVRVDGSNEFVVYLKEKTGSFSSSHSFYNKSFLFTTPDSESLKWSDSIPLKSKSVKIFKNRVFLFNNTEGYDSTSGGTVSLSTSLVSPVVAAPSTDMAINSVVSGGRYNVGIMYFDGFRRTAGVERTSSIIVPDDFLPRLISVDLSGLSNTPSWATHFSIVMTKELTMSRFIAGYTQDVYHFKIDSNGDYTYEKSLTSFDASGTFVDIDSLVKENRGYTFNDGDRIKLYVLDSNTFNTLGLYKIIDVPIISQVGRFLQVETLFELPDLGTSASENIRFVIYTPKQTSEEFFYEIGDTYAIAALTGSVTLIGDINYTISDKFFDTGVSATDPFLNTYLKGSTTKVYIPKMNIWNIDPWVTQAGRGTIKSDSLQINKKSYIRFSSPYIPNSAVLGLNTFEALDEHVLPVENGGGTLLAEAGDVLVGLHEIESTAIYVGEGFVNTSGGSSFLSKTDSVIGDDRRYLGGHGTTHPASVVSRDSRVYFYDSRKGCIVRRSQDGLTVISDYGMKGFVSYLATLHNADSGNSRIVGGWDPQYDCYCISFFLTGGSYNYTMYFHEKTNSWVCVSDLMPIRFGILGQYQLAFATGGGIWKQSPEANYNSFFGTAYSRTIEWEWGADSLMKILEAIEVDSESIYTTAGTNEEIVSVYLVESGTKQTQINYVDFTQREGVWRSPFFNMITDVNFGSALESKFKSPYKVRGQSFYMVMVYNGTDKNLLKSITSFFRPKMLSNQ